MAKKKVKAESVESGTTALRQSGGVVREELLRDLQGSKGRKVIRQMLDNDPIVGAFMFAVEQFLRQVSWRMKPASNDAAAMTARDFVDTCRTDMSHTWSDFITEVLSFLPFGFAYMEIVYKKRSGPTNDSKTDSKYADGLLGWRKMAPRPQESLDKWEFDDEGGIKGMWQTPEGGASVFIPIEKSLLFRTKSVKNNPEGRSILRNAYRPWRNKTRIEDIEGIGIERDLAGLPVMTTPEGLDIWNKLDTRSTAYRTAAEEIVRNIRRDEQEGVLLPFGWELSLLNSGGKRNFDTTAIINRYDQRIAMTVLADFIMLGHGDKTGSFALSKSKTSAFIMSLIGYLGVICDVMNMYAIPRLLLVNGMDPILSPKLDHDALDTLDLDILAKFMDVLAKLGVDFDLQNEVMRRYLLQSAGLPSDELGESKGVATKPTAAFYETKPGDKAAGTDDNSNPTKPIDPGPGDVGA